MTHYSGSYTYCPPGSEYGLYNGYAKQHAAPDAKRFRHEKWNGMPQNRFPHSSQNPYFRSRARLPNPYQSGVPYGQQGGGNFGPHSTGYSFGFGHQGMPYPADQSMMLPVSHYQSVHRPSKVGYSQGSKRSKRGQNHSGGQFTNKSTSDLQAGVLQKLAASHRGGLHANELAHMLSCHRKDVNRTLYSMQREGLVDKFSEQPPRWVLKVQANVSTAHGSDFNSQADTGVKQRNVTSTNYVDRDISARSVVPLRVQGIDSQPASSGMLESYDVIPAVAIPGTNVPASANVHAFSWPSYELGLPKTDVHAENRSFLSSVKAVDQAYQPDVTHPSMSLGSICNVTCAATVGSVSTSDISQQKTVSTSADSLQTVFGELKKPAGRGRGVLLLNAAKNTVAKKVGASSVGAVCEPEHDQLQLEAERFVDDSGIMPDTCKQPVPMFSPIGDDTVNVETRGIVTGQPTVQSELTYSDKEGTARCEVLSGPKADQSLATFKPPLPPKQLIRADPLYTADTNRGVNFHSKDDASLSLHGNYLGSGFVQSQRTDFADDPESDLYRSLPDCLSALSFHASSLPSTRSLDDLRKSYTPTRLVDNPFATALGIEDSSIDSTLPPGQMPEGACSLSLTSESFAALNKNSVSALMEYSQSRHVNIDIKCIHSFGPPHRPVYVFIQYCSF